MNKNEQDANKKPLISVIMPAYNCEKYLEEAVETVLRQSYTNWQLLILNDCSTDGTADILERLKDRDPRIHIYHNEKNIGVGKTRNKGAKLAEGEWIAFLDSDDLWKSNKLERQLDLIEQTPEAQLVFTGSGFIENDGMSIAYVLHAPKRVSKRKLLEQNVVSCSSVLVKKDIFLRHPMPERMDVHEDFASWLGILSETEYAYGVDEPLLIYRKSYSSKSGKKSSAAKMNWRTYEIAGVAGPMRLYYMGCYTVKNVWKYLGLWWNSYRRMMGKERYKKLFQFLVKLILLAVQTAVFSYVYFQYYNNNTILGRKFSFWGHWALMALYLAVLYLSARLFSAFKMIHGDLADVILSQIYTVFIVNGLAYLQLSLIGHWKFLQNVDKMLIVLGGNLAFSVIWVLFVRWLYSHIYPPHDVLLIGGKGSMDHLKKELSYLPNRYHLRTEIDLADGMENVKREIARHESIMLGDDMPTETREYLLRYCYEQKKRCYCQEKITDIMIMSSEKIFLPDTSLLLFKNCGLTVEQRLAKRLFDIVFSVFVLLITSILWIPTAIIIKLCGGGSVFTVQECYTKDQKVFKRYKFRSTGKNDDKLTGFGKVISKLHIDELPLFLNVLKGDMSVVGPYPDPLSSAVEEEKKYSEYLYRLDVKAGVTGYTQVYGWESLSRRNRLSMDLYYIQNYSFGLDMNILATTAKVFFRLH